VTSEATSHQVEVGGYPLRLDRRYDPDTHMWVQEMTDGSVRIGLDALTADTLGALAQLALPNIGTYVARGEELGSLEAAKFVGPLIAPAAGVVAAVNPAVLDDPELVLREPYDGGWLVELDVVPADGEPDRLLGGEAAHGWYAAEVAEHREQGLVAE
jgi:glycine cleavage system H protein